MIVPNTMYRILIERYDSNFDLYSRETYSTLEKAEEEVTLRNLQSADANIHYVARQVYV